LGILIAVIVLIVYGSLYPWTFEGRHLSASPLYLLFHSWDVHSTPRRLLADVAVNIAIYIPLGMSAHLAFRRFRSTLLEIAGPVVLGATLSGAIEMTQLFTPQRNCSTVDLITNTVGSALGVFAGFAFALIANLPVTGPEFRLRDRNAVALLFCWFFFLVFPVFPVIALLVWRAKLLAFVHASWISPVATLLAAAEWLAVGRLLVAAGARRPAVWLVAFMFAIPVQIAIVDRNPAPADLLGAIFALVLFSATSTHAKADRWSAITLIVAVALRGLAPFHFSDSPQPFAWIPFAGLLAASPESGVLTLLRKLFQYGASIWLLHRSGVGLPRAAFLVAAVLAAIEALQTRIPSHVPEISDPLLALLLWLGFLALRLRPCVPEPKT